MGTFSKGKVFLFDGQYKQGLIIKPLLTGAEPVKVNLQKGRKQTYDPNIFNLSRHDLPQKYVTPIKLDCNKLKDLQDLMEFIPSHHTGFMKDLIAKQQALGDLHDTDQDQDPNDDAMTSLTTASSPHIMLLLFVLTLLPV